MVNLIGMQRSNCKNCTVKKLVLESENQSCNCEWFPTHTFVDDINLLKQDTLPIRILKDSINNSENAIKNSENAIKSSQNAIRNSENSIMNDKSCIKQLENLDLHSENSADTVKENLDTNYIEYKF